MGILLFGVVRETVGSSVLEYPAAINDVASLKRWLYEEYPSLKQLSSLLIAVNRTYATDNQAFSNTDEVAIIPPVSGG
ncbi:molybdopterin converting factor subunit 1 [Chitinophaga silvatica]|uniref:Molybdopterin synthase sulfur carrier subunit n=1 Tax=Chitinophaga silvatica TaxID=2282649 RepID=A0A3E1YAF0_9BACT|nr:molybdopterin converting factor subunit 1 [Chitinophaga silvatica]RFS22616.1 molybdopterin converting factor subunit 1 [Chitinophaga silvatica]